MTNYFLTGGGTAGHVNPLLALADRIRIHETDSNISVLGTLGGLEERLVPERGYELLTIDRLPFPRKPSLYALKFPVRYQRAVSQVRQMLRREQIDVVVGFGGFASAPAYQAANKENIPVVIHEANAKPGLANRMGARFASAVAVTFPGTPIRKAKVTGMPLRPEIEQLNLDATQGAARKHFGLDADRPTLLVTGGSLGAKAINDAISSQAAQLVDAGAQVLHVWGGLTSVEDPGVDDYHVIEYCDRMDLAFAACDLVISRAGSTTVSEIAGLGIPAVFVPYSHGNGEQRFNAQSVVEASGALMVEDEQLTPDWVQNTLTPLLFDPAKRAAMAAQARQVGTLEGTENLYRLVQRVLGNV